MRPAVVLAIFVVACSGDGGISPSETGAMTWPTSLSQGVSDSVTDAVTTGAGSSTGDASVTDATTDPTVTSTGSTGSSDDPVSSSSGEPAAITCTYPSTSFGGAAKELMVPAGSSERLTFIVPGLPAAAQVLTATLQFVSHDSDHPGAEGTIIVNGGAPIDLPADAAWENADHATAVDITGATLAGDNTIEFGAGSFPDGTFYRVGQVALELVAHVDACPEAPARPPKPVQIDYDAAIYTKRHNWVLRCDFLDGYAFTAKGDQAQLDCGMLYDPDGTRTGTATFVFADLAPATYEITIKSRHSANRNPKGALFVVDGEGKRIDQTVGEDIVVDTWGTKALAGTVEVVLDSDMEGESDSVTWVRLEPL